MATRRGTSQTAHSFWALQGHRCFRTSRRRRRPRHRRSGTSESGRRSGGGRLFRSHASLPTVRRAAKRPLAIVTNDVASRLGEHGLDRHAVRQDHECRNGIPSGHPPVDGPAYGTFLIIGPSPACEARQCSSEVRCWDVPAVHVVVSKVAASWLSWTMARSRPSMTPSSTSRVNNGSPAAASSRKPRACSWMRARTESSTVGTVPV